MRGHNFSCATAKGVAGSADTKRILGYKELESASVLLKCQSEVAKATHGSKAIELWKATKTSVPNTAPTKTSFPTLDSWEFSFYFVAHSPLSHPSADSILEIATNVHEAKCPKGAMDCGGRWLEYTCSLRRRSEGTEPKDCQEDPSIDEETDEEVYPVSCTCSPGSTYDKRLGMCFTNASVSSEK